MMIVIPKFLLFVMVTSATAVAADSTSTLATKVTIEEEKLLLNNEKRATTTTTTTSEGLAASSVSSLSSSSLVDANAVVVDRTSENNGSSLSSLSSSSLVDANTVVVDRTSENNGSSLSLSSLVDANAVVVDRTSENSNDSGGHFSPNGINNLHVVVDPVNRGDESSSKTSTMHHTETLPADSDGGFSPSGIINHYAVVDVMNDDDGILSFTGIDGGDVFAQRKLVKSSKKVKHPEALCTLSLFADSLFMYANQCFTDIMVTISLCDDTDDTCYISERLPSVPQEEREENQEEEQCFVGGSFPAKQNILYNPSTGDCEFLYVDLPDDPCNMYTGDTGTGSLGLKARINVKNNPDVMFIQFTKDKGLTFYNAGDERVAKKRSPTQDNRYLFQEGAIKPVLSMMPHPFASGHRRLYSKVALKNDTPYKANFARVEYCACADDENDFIASGGTWTADYRGACLVKNIKSSLIIDGRVHQCSGYSSSGAGLSEFFLMWINDVCCLRSSEQSNTECPELDIDYCDPSGGLANCKDNNCAHPMWADGCEACMCYNNGNAAWCDGSRGDFYDKYFEEHGENPWGDGNMRNRKCNIKFNQPKQDCTQDWNCIKGIKCSHGKLYCLPQK